MFEASETLQPHLAFSTLAWRPENAAQKSGFLAPFCLWVSRADGKIILKASARLFGQRILHYFPDYLEVCHFQDLSQLLCAGKLHLSGSIEFWTHFVLVI